MLYYAIPNNTHKICILQTQPTHICRCISCKHLYVYIHIQMLCMYTHICMYITSYISDTHRRKFRSQTSDNVDRWKAEVRRVREEREGQRREEKRSEEKRREDKTREEKRRDEKRREETRREEKRREEERRSAKRRSQKKEDPGVRKGGKVVKHCVFQWLVAP